MGGFQSGDMSLNLSHMALVSSGGRFSTRACALCQGRVASALYDRTGERCEIEQAPAGAGALAILPELPGFAVEGAPPRVTPSRAGRWRLHLCPKARGSFSAANFNRKRRPT